MHELLTERWNSISLRTKITGVTVLLVTLGLLVAGLGTMTVLRNNLLAVVDEKIAQTALASEMQASTCATQVQVDYYIAVVGEGGEVRCHNEQNDPAPEISAMDADDISGVKPQAFTLWDADRTTQWRMVAVPGTIANTDVRAVLVVGLSLTDTNRTINQFTAIFFGFGISVVILGAALTRLLVTSTFRPLRQVEATAAAIAEGNFSQRLPGATPNTEVGRLNRSLNTMLARIDRAFGDRATTIQQMRRFVGDASHELRTPLVSVRGYAELYRMGAITKPEEIAQAMERIEKEAIRMGGLVEDLLELARIDEAKTPILEPVDLVPIAYDAALDAMASSKDRTIDVVIVEPEDDDHALPVGPDTVDPDGADPAVAGTEHSGLFTRARIARLTPRRFRTAEPPQAGGTLPPQPSVSDDPIEDTPAIILAEENKIRQVITNLLGNALRFTDAGSPIQIVVSVDSARGVAVVDIVDHGEGIPPQIREKIFERFWRADTSRTRETGGSGLGLAIVSGIVAAHHGTVEALETEGGGATFRITLPLLPRDWAPPVSTVSS